MKKLVLAALALIFALTALAPLISNAALGPNSKAEVENLKLTGLYRMKKFKEVNATAYIIDGKTKFPEDDETSYVLREREPVRAEFLNNGTVRITRGSIPAEEGINPTQLIVSEEQFLPTDMEPINDPMGRDLTTLYVMFMAEDSANAKAGSPAFASGCSISNWGTGQCVSYIKGTEGIKGTLGNGGAVAGNLLKMRLGYRVVDRGTCMSNPPHGTIASWPGHVAKWDGSCWMTRPARACACNHGDPGRGKPILCVIKAGW